MQAEPKDLFASIIERHKDSLENWALAETKDEEQAKELIQEIYIKIFLFTSKEFASHNDIKSIDNYIWTIAWNTLKNMNKKDKHSNTVSIDTPYFDYFKHNIPYIDPYLDEDNPVIDNTAEYARLRQFILRLDIMEREITIMYYWDKLTASQIATKLKISQYTVKNCIIRIRRKLKTLLSSEQVNMSQIARPRKIFVSCYGNLNQEKKTDSINDDIIKQNICLACFQAPKTIDELLDTLNLSRPYVEPELQWLINKGFLAKYKKEYQSQFFIFTAEIYNEIFTVFEKSKSQFFGQLVSELADRQQKIRSCGFYGADWPFNKLLWFLIPNLVKYVVKTQYKRNYTLSDKKIDFLPIGYECLTNTEEIKELYGEKYVELAPWNKIGYQEFDDDILTFGLIQHGISYQNELSHIIVESGSRYNDLFVRLFTKKASIKGLGKSDREALENMIRWGLWAYSDESHIVPKFCVFTEGQHQALNDIFAEIALELQDELVAFHKIKRICDSYVDRKNEELRKNLFFIITNLYISTAIRFTFYNGQLYKPGNERECAYLSLMVTLKD